VQDRRGQPREDLPSYSSILRLPVVSTRMRLNLPGGRQRRVPHKIPRRGVLQLAVRVAEVEAVHEVWSSSRFSLQRLILLQEDGLAYLFMLGPFMYSRNC
jgi:hypothetical protein